MLSSGHGHAGVQDVDAGGGLEEGHGESVELFADFFLLIFLLLLKMTFENNLNRQQCSSSCVAMSITKKTKQKNII